jgi:ABC-type phosphate/phosphonate transport system substrate-binding protein
MYDREETRAETDRLWRAIADRLRDRDVAAPAALTRGADVWEVWRAPSLVLAQTCGLPYRARLKDAVTLVATPDYALPDCPPGHYRSVVVARPGALPDRPVLAYNEGLSQSGWAAALDWAAGEGLRFGGLLRTGAHAASISAVAEGRADLAAIDAQTWRLARRHGAAPAGLREIARTAPVPGLPLITAAGRDAAPLAEAVQGAITGLSPEDRAALGLAGLARIPAEAYLALPIPPSPEAYAAESGI